MMPGTYQPTKDEKRRLELWKADIAAAVSAKEKWEKDYDCAILEEFVLGAQRDQTIHDEAYIVNLCLPTLKTRLASLVFPYPKTTVSAKPAKADDVGAVVEERSQVMEDVADFLCRDARAGYKESARLALIDAHYRFGWIESGYDMDFITNPNAGKVITKDSEGKTVTEPEEIPRDPHPFFRHIPSEQCYVPAASDPMLERNQWAAYYQWERVEEIRASKEYEHTKDLEDSAGSSVDSYYPDNSHKLLKDAGKGRMKVWHVWNLWERKRYVFPDDCGRFFVDGKPFKTFRISDIKGFPIRKQYYPVPIAYDWIDSQLEINETAEQDRIQARHDNRIYTVLEDRLKESERQKLESAEDGTTVELRAHSDIQALVPPPRTGIVQSRGERVRRDFAEITNIGALQRQSTTDETATAAAISEQRLRMREDDERTEFAVTLANAIKKMLLATIENRQGYKLWVKVAADRSGPQFLQEAMRVTSAWREVNLKDYEGLEFDIEIGIESMPPDTSDSNRNRWNQMLPILGNEKLTLLLVQSPYLLRTYLRMYGIRNERVLSEIRLALGRMYGVVQAQQEVAAFSEGAGGAAGAPAGGGAPEQLGGNAAMSPVRPAAGLPSSRDTLTQLAQQLGISAGES